MTRWSDVRRATERRIDMADLNPPPLRDAAVWLLAIGAIGLVVLLWVVR